MYDITEDMQLNTKIILDDTLSTPIYDFIQEEFNSNLNLEYLLILGDENIIPPIYYITTPTDDYFSSENQIGLPNPNLKTGRIVVNNLNDAHNIVNRIRNYTLNPPEGIWKSKLLLLCDNEY